MKKGVVGFGFGILASLFGVFSGIAVKWVDDEIPTLQLLFIRFAIGFVIMLPVVIKKEGSLRFSTTPWAKHMLRALLGLIGVLSFYYAIPKVNFIDYTVLGRLYPLLMICLGFLFLKEKAGSSKILAALLAVLGAAIGVKPDLSSPPLYILLILFGVLVCASSDIVVKKLTSSQSCEKILLCFFGIATIVLAFFMPFVWVTPATVGLFLPILAIGFLGLLSQYFLTKAYETLNAGTMGVLSSSELIWAVIFGAGIWNEAMGWTMWAGLSVIFMSSLLGVVELPFLKKPNSSGFEHTRNLVHLRRRRYW